MRMRLSMRRRCRCVGGHGRVVVGKWSTRVLNVPIVMSWGFWKITVIVEHAYTILCSSQVSQWLKGSLGGRYRCLQIPNVVMLSTKWVHAPAHRHKSPDLAGRTGLLTDRVQKHIPNSPVLVRETPNYKGCRPSDRVLV